jgi:hypothetical protein
MDIIDIIDNFVLQFHLFKNYKSILKKLEVFLL